MFPSVIYISFISYVPCPKYEWVTFRKYSCTLHTEKEMVGTLELHRRLLCGTTETTMSGEAEEERDVDDGGQTHIEHVVFKG